MRSCREISIHIGETKRQMRPVGLTPSHQHQRKMQNNVCCFRSGTVSHAVARHST